MLAGALETGRADVANQLINTRLRAIEVERKIKEADELEARIEALEAAAREAAVGELREVAGGPRGARR